MNQTEDKNVKKTKAELYKERVMSLLKSADETHLKQGEDSTAHNEEGNSFAQLYEESLKTADFKEGDVVKGKVIAIEDDKVLVDINYKSEGFIPKSEFRLLEGRDEIKIGQELDVYIDSIENDNEMMVLSKNRADIIRIWKDISKVVENEEVIEGTVIAKVKGGLSVDIGVKAFLPGSQIDLRPIRDLDTCIGKKFQFKVIKFNQKRGNIVLSRRVLLSQERKNLRSRMLSEIKEGATVKGIVKNITDYGVFLDLGGLDGLLHITDMSWSRIKHPSELTNLGDELDVKILKFDQEKNRVSLGLKQLKEDPWEQVSNDIKIGDVLKAKVVSLTDYGAFMKLREGVEGLVHVSEMSWGKKIKHPSQFLKPDEEINVKVLGVDQKNHRISLGIKQLKPNPWIQLKEKYPAGTKLETVIKSVTDFGLFMELKGEDVDGFVRSADLSWTEQVNPKMHYKEGDPLSVIVREVNADEGRFNLSVKHLQKDPWEEVESKYPPGSRHKVKVKKLMDFGAFVELELGVEGLIHISELSTQRVETADQVVKTGEMIKAEVLNIDKDARKIGLSVKQILLRGDVEQTTTEKEKEKETETEKKKKTESFFGRALKASLGVKPKEKTDTSSDTSKDTVKEPAKASEPSETNNELEKQAESAKTTEETTEVKTKTTEETTEVKNDTKTTEETTEVKNDTENITNTSSSNQKEEEK